MRAGLYYWVDDNNFVFIGPWVRRESGSSFYYGYDYPQVHRPTFSKMVSNSKDETLFKGDKLGNRDLKNESAKPEAWYLQLERSGVKFIGRISSDGTKWEEIGTHIFVPKTGRIGLGAYQDWDGGNEQAVEFENFVVKGVK